MNIHIFVCIYLPFMEKWTRNKTLRPQQVLMYLKIITCLTSIILHFSIQIHLKKQLHQNPLAWLAHSLALGHQAMEYIAPCLKVDLKIKVLLGYEKPAHQLSILLSQQKNNGNDKYFRLIHKIETPQPTVDGQIWGAFVSSNLGMIYPPQLPSLCLCNILLLGCYNRTWLYNRHKDQSSYVPSQWEPLLRCNNVSHWLGV